MLFKFINIIIIVFVQHQDQEDAKHLRLMTYMDSFLILSIWLFVKLIKFLKIQHSVMFCMQDEQAVEKTCTLFCCWGFVGSVGVGSQHTHSGSSAIYTLVKQEHLHVQHNILKISTLQSKNK